MFGLFILHLRSWSTHYSLIVQLTKFACPLFCLTAKFLLISQDYSQPYLIYNKLSLVGYSETTLWCVSVNKLRFLCFVPDIWLAGMKMLLLVLFCHLIGFHCLGGPGLCKCNVNVFLCYIVAEDTDTYNI